MSTQALIREGQSNPAAVEKGQEVFDGLMHRAATDRAFRTKLTTDPRAALA
jgi:hypothetical protein